MKHAAAVISVLGLLVACSSVQSDESPSSPSLFWDTEGDVRGMECLTRFFAWELGDIVAKSDAVAVVRVSEIADVTRVGIPAVPTIEGDDSTRAKLESIEEAAADMPTNTTYRAEVEEWIDGTGSNELMIRDFGGRLTDGTPVFCDLQFLLEPDRTYLLSLSQGDDGVYTTSFARGSFDVTDGVKVLNNPRTRDLEHLEEIR